MAPGFLLLAGGVNGVIALAARWRRAVSISGALAGFAVGFIVLVTGGFPIWGTLMVFFISSSLLGRVGAERKRALAAMHEKGGERDAVQVFANGGIPMIASVLSALGRAGAFTRFVGDSGSGVFALAAVAGFAAANADTWASELGSLSTRAPRSILTGRPVEPGVSGGVTVVGTGASVAGALVVAAWYSGFSGVCAATVSHSSTDGAVWSSLAVLIAVTVCGTLGSVLDSVIGASLQAVYRTDDGEVTEQAYRDGRPNSLVRGVRGITNDVVNLTATFGAAIVGGLAGAVLF